MNEIFKSFKRDWGRWSASERAGVLAGAAIGVSLILGMGISGLLP